MKKYLWAVFVLCSLLVCQMPAAVFADASPATRVLRIGCADALSLDRTPTARLLHEYTISYLNEISKFGGWTYTYVYSDAAACHQMLQNGELDLMFPVSADMPGNDDLFLTEGFSGYMMLSFYMKHPYINLDYQKIDALNYASIGLVNTPDHQKSLRHFLQENKLHSSVVLYDTPEDMVRALHNGEVTAIVDDGTHVGKDDLLFKTFDIISSQLAMTSQNTALLEKFNNIIQTIETNNPDFETSLEHNFLDPALHQLASYTTDELDFAEHAPVLTIVYIDDLYPFIRHGMKKDTAEGIFPDILQQISEDSGLQFRYVAARSFDDALQKINSGEADLFFGIYNNDQAADHFLRFTNSFMDIPYAIVTEREKGILENTEYTVALPSYFYGGETWLREHHPRWMFDNSAAAWGTLQSVKDHHADFALIPQFTLMEDNLLSFSPELITQPDITISVPISLAISSHNSPLLQTTLNKAILRLNASKLQRSIYEHTTQQLTLPYMLLHYPFQSVCVIVFLIFCAFCAFFIIYRNHLHTKQNKLLTQKNLELQQALESLEKISLSRDSYKYVAEIDALTSVMSKAGIEAVCREAFMGDTAKNLHHALFIVDLDHFKEINDTYGHQHGDDILRRFAESLSVIFRKTDCIGRFGGDEFIIFLPNIKDHQALIRFAKQINTAAHEIEIQADHALLSASIGIALIPEHGQSYEDVFRAADHALYQVKERGRDGYCIYSDDLSG